MGHERKCTFHSLLHPLVECKETRTEYSSPHSFPVMLRVMFKRDPFVVDGVRVRQTSLESWCSLLSNNVNSGWLPLGGNLLRSRCGELLAVKIGLVFTELFYRLRGTMVVLLPLGGLCRLL